MTPTFGAVLRSREFRAVPGAQVLAAAAGCGLAVLLPTGARLRR